jgi:hypothetical protein
MSLPSDDLVLGLKITVLSNQKRETVVGNGLFGTERVIVQTDRSHMGDVLEVVAIDRPFIVVEVTHDKHCYTGDCSSVGSRHVIDTRIMKLMKVSDEFIEALTVKQDE